MNNEDYNFFEVRQTHFNVVIQVTFVFQVAFHPQNKRTNDGMEKLFISSETIIIQRDDSFVNGKFEVSITLIEL